ncbi:MAG: zinc ribbon domain-containing protein [Thermodesulfovibrionales bacterium]|nr:zinc ribbon domain-containing protein [Thermodesulfovibrionales bacterium]
MPIYEYKCDACGHGFSVLTLSSAKASETTCPSCESQDVTKQISAFACMPSATGSGFTGGGAGGG